MRLKILSSVLVIVFIFVLVTQILAIREHIEAQSIEETATAHTTLIQPSTAALVATGEQAQTSLSRQLGITIIRPQQEQPTLSPKAKSEQEMYFAEKSDASYAQSTGSNKQRGSSSQADLSAPETGITRIGHRPTPEEKQDMQTQGIILF